MQIKVANKKSKVLVALSGGVDSAVSAALLKEQGYAVTGAHMVCWDEGPYCSADEDRASAAKVAAHLGIDFKVFDFRREYKAAVVDYFVSEYEEGLTPNPDVACNREIKFGIFFEQALKLGYDFIATGHYARVTRNANTKRLELLAGLDDSKDQSYFLYNLRQKHLNHSLFPIGHLTKREVRTIAQSIDLPNASKKDSQGICFIGDVEIREFLRERVKNKIGNIVNRQGQVLGRHEGLAYYTIGQREGLGISEKIPHYVIDKRTKTNDLLVAPLGEESHFKNLVKAKKVNWVGIKPLVGTLVQARIRYRQPLFEAKITSVTGKSVKLSCPEPQRAVTQGQSVVLYNHQGSVIGGGVIY